MAGSRRSELAGEVLRRYLPNAAIVLSEEPKLDSAIVPWLEGREMVDGKPAAYVCENFVCQRPVTEVEDLDSLLQPV